MGVVDNVKDVVKLVREIDNLELYRKIVDLQSEVTELVQENMRLNQQVRDLEEKVAIQGQLEIRKDGYWLKREDGKEDGPFCTGCWDGEKKLIRQVQIRSANACPVCHTIRVREGRLLTPRHIAEVKMQLGNHSKPR